MINFDGNTKWV